MKQLRSQKNLRKRLSEGRLGLSAEASFAYLVAMDLLDHRGLENFSLD